MTEKITRKVVANEAFEEAEPELEREYTLTRTELDPEWQDIRPAARAAWDRVDRGWEGKL